ncbi:hypothetical protein [Ruminococcus albus]|uniref:Uncharacterized protein n=1 Tax=Ruminococcus albus (strain ATCC 27210 / DSM 20455 / JCM 14654 / NCDO 2250 / 7) TaxID=697329 RepID=E6UK88_RUMA7|nr:hypothetical protein [Ruminococcus albus]ADU24084.1 hypothetical protein Rumal_3645 [Ruminococcus albus 7 = DSM 20455]
MKNTKKIIASVMAIAMISAIVPISAFATDYNAEGNAMTDVTWTSSAVYTVTIPATVALGNEATIEAGNVNLNAGEQLNVTLSGTSDADNAFKLTTATDSLTYTVSKGGDNVAVGDVVLNVAAGTQTSSSTLKFNEPATTPNAGDYTGTVTFTISVESAETIVDLSTLTADYVAKDGVTLTGTLAANVKISIADGATVTLKDANITNLGKNCDWAGINCPNDATIILKGTNTICAGRGSDDYNNYPGIWIAKDKTLTIGGDGSLTAYSNAINPGGAGIGGGYQVACGNIVINGGTITATGGDSAAGIGGGPDTSCGDITINGGTITATGYNGAAGIGSGRNTGVQSKTSCGNITIANTVTKVTATKGKGDTGAHSIGPGGGGVCGTVTIGNNVGAISVSPYTYEP